MTMFDYYWLYTWNVILLWILLTAWLPWVILMWQVFIAVTTEWYMCLPRYSSLALWRIILIISPVTMSLYSTYSNNWSAKLCGWRCSGAGGNWAFIATVKPVCNDHLYNKIYYLWFIQWFVLMKPGGTNLLLLSISAVWSSSRWPVAT